MKASIWKVTALVVFLCCIYGMYIKQIHTGSEEPMSILHESSTKWGDFLEMDSDAQLPATGSASDDGVVHDIMKESHDRTNVMAGYAAGIRDTALATTSTNEEMMTNGDNNGEDTDESWGRYIFGETDTEFRLEDVEKYLEISENIFSSFPNCQNSSEYLIYHCSTKCGGLGDRLKGIVFVYIMSILTHRRFAINMTTPCELQEVLEPNLLDWRKPSFSDLKGKTYKLYDYFEANNAYLIDYERYDLDPMKMFEADVSEVRANQDWTRVFRKMSVTSKRFPQLYQFHSSDILRIIYNGLFKPNKDLKYQVDTFFKDKVGKSRLACLHARMGEKQYPRYTQKQIMTPLLFLKKYDSKDNYKILVASDSDVVKDIAAQMFRNFIDTEGPVLHIDHINTTDSNLHTDGNQNIAGFMRTIVDHTILQRCDTLILTGSGFSVTAGSIRHTSSGLYVYMRDDAVVATKRELVREAFQWRCIIPSWGTSTHDYFTSICDS